MSIWKRIFGSMRGGQSLAGWGFGDRDSFGNETLTAEVALRLSAVLACVSLRAETVGSMPIHLRDGNKQVLTDHPLYNILHRSPNADMTAAEFWSLATAHVDLKGNFVCIIERRSDKSVVALTPVDSDGAKMEYNKTGRRKRWKIGKDEFSDDDILHLRGFSIHSDWGAPRLDLGRQILTAQLQADRSAQLAFKQGLKVGGFILNEGKHDFTSEQLTQVQARFAMHSRPENAYKWMHLLRGMKPLPGKDYTINPSEAQLLESRYFGIEEICRLFQVPPPLIGHTSKASSWASSIENLNLHFVVYSLAPTNVRDEQRIEKKLLTPYDRAEGVQAKRSMGALLRGDTKARQSLYTSGLQNGYLSQNEVRDLEDMPGIGPEGDVYRVQLNMANAEDGDDKPAKQEDEK